MEIKMEMVPLDTHENGLFAYLIIFLLYMH